MFLKLKSDEVTIKGRGCADGRKQRDWLSNVNVVNAITSFVKPTPPTNIIANETILTKYSIKQRLKVFGKKGEAAVHKELQQFHDCRVVEPKKPQDLSYEQWRRSLEYLIFLKLKIDEVTIKARGCTYRRKHRD